MIENDYDEFNMGELAQEDDDVLGEKDALNDEEFLHQLDVYLEEKTAVEKYNLEAGYGVSKEGAVEVDSKDGVSKEDKTSLEIESDADGTEKKSNRGDVKSDKELKEYCRSVKLDFKKMTKNELLEQISRQTIDEAEDKDGWRKLMRQDPSIREYHSNQRVNTRAATLEKLGVHFEERDEFDVETILSTRSNMFNHPGTVKLPTRSEIVKLAKGLKAKSQASTYGGFTENQDNVPGRLTLDLKNGKKGKKGNKSGLGLDTICEGEGDEAEDDEQTCSGTGSDSDSLPDILKNMTEDNLDDMIVEGDENSDGESPNEIWLPDIPDRKKKETPEEKRQRKKQVKQTKQLCRKMKKENKQMFKKEELKYKSRNVQKIVGDIKQGCRVVPIS